jgi:hypothetical protein
MSLQMKMKVGRYIIYINTCVDVRHVVEYNYLTDYGMKWLMAWWETNNFNKWNQYTDHEIYEIVEPG